MAFNLATELPQSLLHGWSNEQEAAMRKQGTYTPPISQDEGMCACQIMIPQLPVCLGFAGEALLQCCRLICQAYSAGMSWSDISRILGSGRSPRVLRLAAQYMWHPPQASCS